MIFHYNILIIKTIKHQSYYRENMYVFFQKHVQEYRENTYVFWETNNEIVKTFGKIYNNPMASRTWKRMQPSC